MQSSRWQKLAAIPEERFEEAVSAAKQIAGEVTTAGLLRPEKSFNHRAQYTGEQEWYTPQEYYEAASPEEEFEKAVAAAKEGMLVSLGFGTPRNQFE